jgi:hypothetical protein
LLDLADHQPYPRLTLSSSGESSTHRFPNVGAAYAVQANAFAVIPLLAGIIIVGNNRFLSEAIDPTLRKEDAATQINGRVVDNTLQQFVLFLVATTTLSVNLTAARRCLRSA